jgi:hypothetical protein
VDLGAPAGFSFFRRLIWSLLRWRWLGIATVERQTAFEAKWAKKDAKVTKW